MDDVCWLDAHDQARLVERGEVSPRELVVAAIERIERLEPELNALVDVDFEWALHRAERAEGPWRGVPFLIKDVIAYPELRWSMGSRALARQVAEVGSAYTDCLDLAGLVVLGKTTTSELGLLASTECLAEGATRNPWDKDRSALGSSGGSAVAVASGMVPVAHGSDGGGSIRLPASATGLFGFKPSSRLTHSTGPDFGPMTDLICHHCVSRSVRDSARLLAMTEADLSPWPTVGFVSGPSRERLRIGAYREVTTGDAPDPEVVTVLEGAMKLCADLGHEVIEMPGPAVSGLEVARVFFSYAGALVDDLCLALEARNGRRPGPGELEPYTLSLLEWFRSQDHAWRDAARAASARISSTMTGFLSEVDVTLCPTTPFLPPPLGTVSPTMKFEADSLSYGLRMAGYTAVHNVVGAPAMSLPLAMSRSGLPVGVMFAAAPGRDRRLLELAYELEEASPWGHRRPAVG